MRVALFVMALTSCGPLPRAPKCAEVPAPTADEFAACGGITYHAGPGPVVPFTIRFKSELAVRSVCVLVDGYSLFASDKLEWSGNLFRGKHVVKVQAVVANNTNTYTIRSASEIASLEPGVLELHVDKGPALRWVKPKGSTCD
jgi:hypothetical protein